MSEQKQPQLRFRGHRISALQPHAIPMSQEPRSGVQFLVFVAFFWQQLDLQPRLPDICTRFSFSPRTRFWRDLHFLKGFMGTSANTLFCHSVTTHYVRREGTVEPVGLCHRHTRHRVALSQIRLVHNHRANSHVRDSRATNHLTSGLIQVSP